MQNSVVSYTGDGVSTDWVFPFPYFSQNDVIVKVNDIVAERSFVTDSLIRLTRAPAAGSFIRIQRLTPKDSVPVNFTDGSTLLERDLDLLTQWALYTAQEASDNVGVSSEAVAAAQAAQAAAAVASAAAVLAASAFPAYRKVQELIATTEGQRIFTLTDPYTVGISALQIDVGGLGQPPSAFVETDNHTFTLSEGVPLGTRVVAYIGIGASPEAGSSDFTFPAGGAITKTVFLNLIEKVRVVNYGVASGQTAALNSSGMQSLFNNKTRFEAVFNDGDYKFDSLLTVPPGNNVHLTGAGMGATQLFQMDLTKGLLKFNLGYARGGGVRGMDICGFAPFLTHGSTGIAIQIVNANTAFVVDQVTIERFDKAVRIDGSYYVTLQNFNIRSFSDYGIYIPPYSGADTTTIGSRLLHGNISNAGYSGANTASVGILAEQGSGEYWKSVDVTGVGTAYRFKPPTDGVVAYLFMDACLADASSTGNGWDFDATAGKIVRATLVNCWASFNAGAGMVTKGAGIDGLTWIEGSLRENGMEGWDHQGGSRIKLLGTSVSRNGRSATNTLPGIRIRSGQSGWSLIGVESGNLATATGVTTEQAEGLLIESGTSTNFRVIGSDFSNPGTGKQNVVNGTTVGGWIMTGNTPSSIGINVDRGAAFSFTSGGTVAAGVSTYLGCMGAKPIEADTVLLVGEKTGYLGQVLVQCETAPGVSQSFTYTVMLNGTATSMAGSISGAGVFQAVISANGFAVTAGSRVSVRLVTSAGAAVARHFVALSINT